MKLIIGGCRGTAPVAQPDFMRYGGETTSFLIEGAAGERVLIDAGTGVRSLGQRLERSGGASSLLLLFTHYHLDHVAGLPSLGLIYSPQWHIEVASPRRGGHLVGEVIPRVLHKPFWPLQVEHLKSRIQFTTLRGQASLRPRELGGLRLSWCEVHHPDGCTAYRFDEPATGASCVIATDMEWGLSSAEERAALLRLCREPSPAALLVMDGQYDDAEYGNFRGWGHSTWQEVQAVAREAGVRRALVTHHAPARNDDEMERREAGWGPALRAARERMEIEVGSP